MKAKRFQVLGSVVGGFLSGAAFWACSEPATGTAADTCECTSEVSALESRISVRSGSAGMTPPTHSAEI